MMILFLTCFGFIYSSTKVFDPFDDTISFEVSWGDPEMSLDSKKETISMVTNDNEFYTCQLPVSILPSSGDNEDSSVKAREILEKLAADKSCSYRVDSYWIYEVCHGRHIKQFHEERNVANKKLIVKQEYFLGYAETVSYSDIKVQAKDHIPTMSHAGALRPYYPVVYRGGTECDLKSGYKRKTTVFYMCMPDFQTSVVSVKETTTCEYEIIIYTSLLCKSSAYRIKEDPINRISCFSNDGKKHKRPIGYKNIEGFHKNTLFGKSLQQDGNPHTLHPKSEANKPTPQPKKSQLTFPEKNFVKNFITGKECVVGGAGWWKYEFCFQKSIKQFHQEKNGKKTEIILGMWDENKHKVHLAEHKIEVSNVKTFIDLYFFSGTICDQTGIPRQTKVRLRCAKNGNIQALTMFLEEPSVCVYQFTAESALFCEIIKHVDDRGIPQVDNVDNLIENL